MRALALSLLLAASAGPAAAAQPSTAAPRALSTEDRRRALLLADLLIEEGRLGDAEALTLERLGADPERWDWELRLARVREAQRRHAEAAAAYRRLLAERGNDPGLLLQYGRQAAAAGELRAAREAYEKARGISDDPVIAYELSEVEHALGRSAASRRWGELALAGFEDLEGPGPRRLRLRLLARLRWDDSLPAAFGRLYDRHQQPEVLSDWAGALIRRGLAREAEEPVALLRERHPRPPSRWRLLELERLRRAGDAAAVDEFVDESLAALPEEPALLLAAGEREMRRRAWPRAEELLLRARQAQSLEREADDLLVETRRRGHHHAGPFARWRRTGGGELTEAGAAYAGYPRRGLRLEAEAAQGRYTLRDGERFTASGLEASLAREAGPWTLGADLDLSRLRGGGLAASPGLFGGWQRGSAQARAALRGRRAWRSSPQAAAAQARADELELAGRLRLAPRLSAAATARLSRFTLEAGEARQSMLAPELSFAWLESPFYSALSYRLVALDGTGADAFYARLPLLRRSRVHYAVLSAGRWWLRGRLRADGYIFNGHEPERGRRFGTDALLGWGVNAEWILARVTLSGGYEDTREVFEGVGGRSQAAKAGVTWRWGGPR